MRMHLNHVMVQSLTIDVAKLKGIVRLADMMLCGSAVGMLMEGVTGLQARLASQAPLLVLPAFTNEGVHFEPESQQMLKVCSLVCLSPACDSTLLSSGMWPIS
jgi:hypothetical protein